jgi:hypothetical protein
MAAAWLAPLARLEPPASARGYTSGAAVSARGGGQEVGHRLEIQATAPSTRSGFYQQDVDGQTPQRDRRSDSGPIRRVARHRRPRPPLAAVGVVKPLFERPGQGSTRVRGTFGDTAVRRRGRSNHRLRATPSTAILGEDLRQAHWFDHSRMAAATAHHHDAVRVHAEGTGTHAPSYQDREGARAQPSERRRAADRISRRGEGGASRKTRWRAPHHWRQGDDGRGEGKTISGKINPSRNRSCRAPYFHY